MKKSEIVQTLFALQEEQLKELRRFADSDLVNRGSRRLHVLALLKHLMKLFPNSDCEEVLQGNVWKSLFGKKEFDKAELSKISSDALSIIKEFIVKQEQEETAEIDRLFFLTKFYSKKGLEKYFNQSASEFKKRIEASTLSDRWSCLEEFKLNDLNAERNANFYLSRDASGLHSAFQNLDLFFLLSKLRLSCIISVHNQVAPRGAAAAQDWLELDAPLLKKYETVPSVEIWLTAYQLFQEGGEIHYEKLNKLIDEQQNTLPFHDLAELSTHLRLFCNRQFLTTGNQEFLGQLFSLQSKHLQYGYLQTENGKIPQNSFLSLVLTGIKLKRYQEVETALKTVGQNIIGADQPEKTRALNQALLAFATGQVREALKLIPSHDFEDVQYQIVCRVLWMKIWYETDELDRLESEINTFRVYIHRACEEKRVITPARKEVNLAFLRFLSALLKLKFTRPKEQILEKIAELNEKKTVADREWLLEKMENLLKR